MKTFPLVVIVAFAVDVVKSSDFDAKAKEVYDMLYAKNTQGGAQLVANLAGQQKYRELASFLATYVDTWNSYLWGKVKIGRIFGHSDSQGNMDVQSEGYYEQTKEILSNVDHLSFTGDQSCPSDKATRLARALAPFLIKWFKPHVEAMMTVRTQGTASQLRERVDAAMTYIGMLSGPKFGFRQLPAAPEVAEEWERLCGEVKHLDNVVPGGPIKFPGGPGRPPSPSQSNARKYFSTIQEVVRD